MMRWWLENSSIEQRTEFCATPDLDRLYRCMQVGPHRRMCNDFRRVLRLVERWAPWALMDQTTHNVCVVCASAFRTMPPNPPSTAVDDRPSPSGW